MFLGTADDRLKWCLSLLKTADCMILVGASSRDIRATDQVKAVSTNFVHTAYNLLLRGLVGFSQGEIAEDEVEQVIETLNEDLNSS